MTARAPSRAVEVKTVVARETAGPTGERTVLNASGYVTARREAMRDSQRLTDIFDATHDLVAIADNQGSLLYLNDSARQFFELPADGPLSHFDMLGQFGTEMIERLSSEVQPELEREGMWYGELPVQKPDGTLVPHRVQLLAHKDEAGHSEFFSAVLHDISERKAIEHRLAHQATHDPLTGLPNRTLLLIGSTRHCGGRRTQRRAAVLFLDLDHSRS
jgi:PAS domain S-box-containing protein